MNHKLDLEFIEQPLFSITSSTWLGLFILLVSLILAMFTWQTYQKKQLSYENLTAEVNQLHKKNNHKKVPVKLVSIFLPAAELKQLAESVNKLTTPWDQLLTQIELAETIDIALLSLEPSTKKQQITLTGEAKNLPAALEYINQLENQPNIAEVYLQKHSIDEANPYKPLTFTIIGQWLTTADSSK